MHKKEIIHRYPLKRYQIRFIEQNRKTAKSLKDVQGMSKHAHHNVELL